MLASCDVTGAANIDGSGGILWNNYIYMIGGVNDGANKDCIVSFDIETKKVNYVMDYPITISRYGIAYVYISRSITINT